MGSRNDCCLEVRFEAGPEGARAADHLVQGRGFRVQGLGFRVQG